MRKEIAYVLYALSLFFSPSLSLFFSPNEREIVFRLRNIDDNRRETSRFTTIQIRACARASWSPANRDAHAWERTRDTHLWYRTLRCQRRRTCQTYDVCIVERRRERLSKLELYDSTGSSGDQWYPLLDACSLLSCGKRIDKYFASRVGGINVRSIIWLERQNV